MEAVLSLMRIRLELARTREFPDGSAVRGYEFVAPLDADGFLDMEEWQRLHQVCTVHRFWPDEDDENGLLIRSRGGQWVFSYEPGEEDDEPIFRLDRHQFVDGEYIAITEHDGVTRPFRIAEIEPAPMMRN